MAEVIPQNGNFRTEFYNIDPEEYFRKSKDAKDDKKKKKRKKNRLLRWQEELLKVRKLDNELQVRTYQEMTYSYWNEVFVEHVRPCVKEAYRAIGDRIFCGQYKRGKSGSYVTEEQLAVLREWCGDWKGESIIPLTVTWCDNFNDFWEKTFAATFAKYIEDFVNVKNFRDVRDNKAEQISNIVQQLFASEDFLTDLPNKINHNVKMAKFTWEHPPWYDCGKRPHMDEAIDDEVLNQKNDIYTVTFYDLENSAGMGIWLKRYKRDDGFAIGAYIEKADINMHENDKITPGSRLLAINDIIVKNRTLKHKDYVKEEVKQENPDIYTILRNEQTPITFYLAKPIIKEDAKSSSFHDSD